MTSAYNPINIYNLTVLKAAKNWCKHGFIEKDQLGAIRQTYAVPLYHPNSLIRILLFVATLFALSGATGFFTLIVADSGRIFISLACIVYGLASFYAVEKFFIAKNHYKSGVTEAIIYHSCGFVIGGLGGISDFNTHILLWSCLVIFSFAAFRYLDLVCTVCAIGSLAGILFFEFYSLDGIFKQIIPFVFMLGFAPVYFISKKLSQRVDLKLWRNNLLILEVVSLLLIYVGGNYLVVRELSVELMGLAIEEGADIPFAFIFYTTTVLFPVIYLFFGIKNKDIILLRVSLILIAFSAFTFKYYFSLGHPEITLTAAGIILIVTAISVMHYLKKMRNGFTRENLLTERWGNMNAEAFLISQTMGGNQTSLNKSDLPGGGQFGGGGSTNDF